MANVFVQYTPALRTVNSGGTVIAGPTDLYLARTSLGIWLADTRVEYVPEMLGEWLTYSYGTRWRLLGYRPKVTLSFALLETDTTTSAYGLDLLLSYYTAGLASETYAALQFNLFSAVYGSSWRGVIPKSPWAPTPAQGKQLTGHELTLDLVCTDLVSSPGAFRQGKW